ncbi:zinc-binding alcohol dehydrogenase family protein [Deinococcus oregonensis]|uniref:Zinc-binding alcohol dehydrogenase family protein n=1 Tax=Deinococcus oregonensis TaxID=1805970 RepID=A0ABV6B187_9DEIO
MSHAIVVSEHGGPDVLHWQPRPLPVPAPGQVRVEVTCTGVNFADIQARRGGYDAGGDLPFVPGLDAVGMIDRLGEGVTGLEIGQRVACFPVGGSYATHVTAPAHLTYPLPASVADESAAALTMLVTAWNTLHQAARLEPGETVLIHAAAGGVGHLAVQLARQTGAARIVAVVGSAERADFVRSLGADEVIERQHQDFATAVTALTNGRGVDVILDSIGGEVTERGLTCLAPLGRLVVFGHASGQPAHFTTPTLHRQGRAVIGYSTGNLRKVRPERLRPSVAAVWAALAAHQIKVHFGADFPLTDAAHAHLLVESGQINGKVLLRPKL